jgi:hypothetical protein
LIKGSRRNIEVPYVAQARGDRFGEIDFDAAGAGLVADVQVPAGGGRYEVPNIDVLRHGRSLDVGQGIRERAGILSLRSGEPGGVTADAAAASDHGEQGQEGGQFRESVMLITPSHVVVHRFNAPHSIAGTAVHRRCNVVNTHSLNLICLILASSFQVRAQSVNALTEELPHIRFSVHVAENSCELAARIRVSRGWTACREKPTSAE